MSSDTLSSALRLELTMKVEKRVRTECAQEKADLENAVESLQLKLQTATEENNRLSRSTIATTEHESIISDMSKQIDDLSTQLKKSKTSFYEGREEFKLVKAELTKLKELDPKGLKKRLDDTKKKLKEKTNTNAQLTAERQQLKSKVAHQKKELDGYQALSEASKSDYLYQTEDELFQVIGTVFKSESHPFVVNGMNYRVVNQKTGASFVAQYKDGKVVFNEEFDCPEDVMSFLQENIDKYQRNSN